ncbi:phosphodiester glycosidase family protein [Jiella sp. MQZ9-1]|uniref:Phosphodiester glycosidase family protein n=1 Tax=Jiella flava TaxID=2816857 RepID=A0A939JU24_9HYPH|nr:phosphodiester glycosidase family protein [Jiella flava]MBO0662735.1 phosphodiester glycosidase family protein [Jiella flava]MCD2471157.1 phosphodiester glycosidase family protein [Jiella flava]
MIGLFRNRRLASRLASAWPATLVAVGSLLSWLQTVPALPAGHDGLCRTESVGGIDYIVCDVPLDRHQLSLRALDAAGRPYETFEAAKASMGGRRVDLIMNAGMYHESRQPVGLAVQDGKTLHGAVLGTGSGNYSLRPNGVFFVENGRAHVMESTRYLAGKHHPELATQSGPMLLIDGKLHPRFIETSDSRNIRNGVCAREDGRLVTLVLSRAPVNFYDFASVFKDRLGCRDALFFDGTISSLYYPAGGIDYRRDRLGPMLVVTDRRR